MRKGKQIDAHGNTGRVSTLHLLLLGLVFHVTFIPLVFDCYFTSPVVNGMKHFRPRHSLAKRLVLIVGDGLRADLLFNTNPFPNIPHSPHTIAPYLRSIVEQRGAFGISHTRVPTESRPGHVAIIAGMYEDVSAVTKGWKTNPVDFDSVFNQSSVTYSFGSPDILPMFARGATPGKVHMWCYDESEEDFTKDATALDIWSYEHLEQLLRNSTTDSQLLDSLSSDGVVFFLHLLGLDTTGHSYRPHSKEYMRNIQVVDEIVKKTENLINSFYRDNETAFIFTADHGMSNIGNHGDGDPDNTQTPLITWGAGIRGPLPDTSPSSHDSISAKWDLENLLRVDMEQADIAALMSALIGIDWPVNSVGVLPDILDAQGYLKASEAAKADFTVVNTKAILEQYRMKHRLKQMRTYFYQPFSALQPHKGDNTVPGAIELHELEHLMKSGDWTKVKDRSKHLIELALEGLRYLQTYDRLFLRGVATAGYTGWAAFSGSFVLSNKFRDVPSSGFAILAALVSLAIAFTFIYIQSSPFTYYIYVCFPCYFWHEVVQAGIHHLSAQKLSAAFRRRDTYQVIAWIVLTLLAMQAMVAGYTHRSVWSVSLLLIGIVWPLFRSSEALRAQNHYPVFGWLISCLCTAIFPLLPVEMMESRLFIIAGATVMTVIATLGITLLGGWHHSTRTIFLSQIGMLVASLYVTVSSVQRLQAREGLPRLNQIASWTILVLGMMQPYMHRRMIVHPDLRMLMYFLGSAPLFVILSISVEGIFYSCFTSLVYFWTLVEPALATRASPKNENIFSFDNVRIAVFFLLFTQVGFFGIGNVASISSFYLEPVYRLVPIFNPFIMTSLLVLKIVAPFIILSAAFAKLHDVLTLPPFSLFMLALSLTDIMTLTFFYRVRDQGSWLEIGQTISFFIISSLLLVWSGGICSTGYWLMSGTKTNKIKME